MRGKDNNRTAAEVLIDQLRIHGVQHVFCVPGESYLAASMRFMTATSPSPFAGRRAGPR